MNRTTIIVSPAYMGVALQFSWIYLLFYANTAGIEAAAPISLMSAGYMISAMLLVATVLVIAFTRFIKPEYLVSVPTKVGVAVIMSSSTVLFIIGDAYGVFAAFLAGSVFTGISSGVMTQQWIYAYRRLGIKIAICSLPALMAMSICVCLTVMYLPKPITLGTTALMPIISEIMLHHVRLDLLPEYDIDYGPRDKPANFILLLLPISLYSLATGFLDFYSSEGAYTYIFYALIALITMAVAILFALITSRQTVTQTVLLPLAFLVVAGVPSVSLSPYVPAAQFISIGELGQEVVAFTIVTAFSEFFSLNGLKTFALAKTCLVIFNSLGWYAAQALEGTLTTLGHSQLSLFVLLVGVEALSVSMTIFVVKAQKNVVRDNAETEAVQTTSSASASSSNEKANAQNPYAERAPKQLGINTEANGFDLRCQKASNTFGLSQREQDVLLLLARGFSNSRIQQELYIAQGTVNYHTRNIYAKLGIHSKQELIDLVASFSAE